MIVCTLMADAAIDVVSGIGRPLFYEGNIKQNGSYKAA